MIFDDNTDESNLKFVFIYIRKCSIQQTLYYIYQHRDTNLYRSSLFLVMFHHSFWAGFLLECIYVAGTCRFRERTSVIHFVNKLGW